MEENGRTAGIVANSKMVSVRLRKDILERILNACYYTPGLTFREVINRGAEMVIQDIESKNIRFHGEGGGAYPPRKGELRKGPR